MLFPNIEYDQAFREIGGQFYENITASKEEVFSQIFQEEGIGELPCEPFSYEELKKSVIEEEKKRFYEGELTPTSQIGIREEKLLRGESRQNIEEAILCYAQAELEEAGYEEITLLAARVYGSRTRETLYREDSDLDVALSYTGDIREDAFFNLLQENGMRIAGLKIDINPISLEKTGTLQEYIKRAEQYLDEREAEKQGQIPQETLQEPQISFYAAECMEFPSMGEYYENLTLEEAVEKYKMIPSDRIHGIKGIGFCLKDGSIYDGEYELMSGGKISKDLIDLVPHYKESPLVQKAMQDLERILAEKQRENTAEQTKAEGTMGRKVSVLKALKERKELLKKQEKKEKRPILVRKKQNCNEKMEIQEKRLWQVINLQCISLEKSPKTEKSVFVLMQNYKKNISRYAIQIINKYIEAGCGMMKHRIISETVWQSSYRKIFLDMP